MKKLFLIAIVMTLLFGLTGCYSTRDEKDDSMVAGEENVIYETIEYENVIYETIEVEE